MKKVAKISTANNEILVERLDDDRVEHHGFGTFFWHIRPEEIEIDEETLEFLKPAVNREYSSMGDLFGMEIRNYPNAENKDHRGFSLTYGSRAKSLQVPLEDVGIDLDFFMQLKQMKENE